LSICLVCVAFYDLILICIVLVLFILTASRSLFLYMLTWMIKLILSLVNFLTAPTSPAAQRSPASPSLTADPPNVAPGCLVPDTLASVTTLLLLKVDVSIVAFPRLQFDFDYAADL
jgi:hypothetical protein